MACRDLKKSLIAADKIIKSSQNQRVEVVHLDLADLSSVRKFANDMYSSLTKLDLLVNNAGVFMCPNWRTKDGFEMQLGVNHLGKYNNNNKIIIFQSFKLNINYLRTFFINQFTFGSAEKNSW